MRHVSRSERDKAMIGSQTAILPLRADPYGGDTLRSRAPRPPSVDFSGRHRMSADGRLILQICLCTHNPRPEILHKVLTALRRQTASIAFELVVVDNASTPPIEEWVCRNALGAGIPLR